MSNKIFLGGKNFSYADLAPPCYGPVDFYTSQKTNIFLRTLSVLAKFDLENQGVLQPVQLHTVTFNAQLPVFDETLAQPDFVCVSLPCFNAQPDIFAVMNCCVVALSLFFSESLTWSADSLYSVQWHIK